MTPVRTDVLVLGGGVAGLWTLHTLLDCGFDALLVEAGTLGGAQSMQAQGIVHGGGKYALRRVGDIEAIRQIRAMPERWRQHRAGLRRPSLQSSTTTSDQCWLWLPSGSWRARLEALTLMPLLRHGGVLAAPPRPRPRAEWPEPLRAFAMRAYSMDEPVFEPVSVIRALAAPVSDRLLRAEPLRKGGLIREADGFRLAFGFDGQSRTIESRWIVACAGAGNADVLEVAGHDPRRMQKRELRMGLVRGALPALHGHCILGGKTRLTITSIDVGEGRRVWQVGGEFAERRAATNDDGFYGELGHELRVALPGLSLSDAEVADYPAVRAEAATEAGRRPSGVQVEAIEERFLVAWPTKWAMAPLLADEVLETIRPVLSPSSAPADPGDWPRAELGTPPWEQATWRDAHSAVPV